MRLQERLASDVAVRENDAPPHREIFVEQHDNEKVEVLCLKLPNGAEPLRLAPRSIPACFHLVSLAAGVHEIIPLCRRWGGLKPEGEPNEILSIVSSRVIHRSQHTARTQRAQHSGVQLEEFQVRVLWTDLGLAQ